MASDKTIVQCYTIFRPNTACQIRLTSSRRQLTSSPSSILSYQLMISMAPLKDTRYDFQNAVTFALNTDEVAKLGLAFNEYASSGTIRDAFQLTHDKDRHGPNAGEEIKYLSLIPGRDPGSVFLNLTYSKRGQNPVQYSVPLFLENITVLRTIIPRCICIMSGIEGVLEV